jgi:lanosterol synthase
MTEYNYPECTTSVITGLAIFRKSYPNYRTQEINNVTHKALEYLHHAQQPNGGWVGSWGICFTYATMFALESLSLTGETYRNSESSKRACDFLVSKQNYEGGWGESYRVSLHYREVERSLRELWMITQSCETSEYVPHEKSQVVQTSWAVMALMYAGYPHRGPIEKGVRLVMNRQLPVGFSVLWLTLVV